MSQPRCGRVAAACPRWAASVESALLGHYQQFPLGVKSGLVEVGRHRCWSRHLHTQVHFREN